jgi:hypothetical protein
MKQGSTHRAQGHTHSPALTSNATWLVALEDRCTKMAHQNKAELLGSQQCRLFGKNVIPQKYNIASRPRQWGVHLSRCELPQKT